MAINETLGINFKKFVSEALNLETFWIRYFCKIDELNQAEVLKALVEEEDLSWDVDDSYQEDASMSN